MGGRQQYELTGTTDRASAASEPERLPSRAEPSLVSRQARRAAMVVAAVALLAAGLRGVQADAYLPWQHHYDEQTNVRVGERMVADGTFDPGFYDYPALVFIAQRVVLMAGSAMGDLDVAPGRILDRQSPANAHVREPGMLLALRWAVGVLPGLVTVVGAAVIGWTVVRRWWVAGVASLGAALSVVDLRFGTFVTPDALSGAAATVSALGAVAIAARPTSRRYLLTGVAVGLAAGAKYNAVVVVVALVTAHLIVHRDPWAERRLLVRSAAAAAVAFFVVNVGALLHPWRFFREIGSEGYHYGRGHFGAEGSSALFNASWLWQSFGLALVFAAVALWSRSGPVRRAAVVLASFVGTYYVFVSAFPVRFARNLLPVTGALAALAALGTLTVAERVGEWLGHRDGRSSASGRHALLGSVGTSIALVVPLIGVTAAVRDVGTDPWRATQQWLTENVPTGATIAVEARAPYVDPSRYDVVSSPTLGQRRLSRYVAQGVDWFVAAKETYQPYLDDPQEKPNRTRLYRRILSDDCVVHVEEDAGQRIVVTRVPPC